jgi:hypothetical protein
MKSSFNALYLTSFLAAGLFTALVSCGPTNYAGRYELRHVPKTYFELKDEGTFKFTSIYPNPYLHPFDHPDEYYFTTTGRWRAQNGKIILNSFADSLVSQPPDIIENRVIEDQRMDTTINIDGKRELLGHSTVTFFDIFNDTINVLSIHLPDGTSLSRLHASMRYADWFTQLSDTAEFHFFGYPPFTLSRTDKKRRETRIRLYPEYRPYVFIARELVINRNRIKDHKFKFDKKKKPHNNGYMPLPD